MEKNNNYPDLTYPEVYKVQTIFIKLKKDQDYIKNSPYSEAVKTSLSSMFSRKNDGREEANNKIVELDLEAETNLVYTRTKNLMNKPLEPKEEFTILKGATETLGKLLDLAERAKNQRYVRDLEQKIIKIAHNLPEESRNELLNMLKE